MVCLLVGEGDFSFALALAAQQRDPAEELVASCPRGCVDEARANVDKLTAMGVRVLMDVDARRLHEHPWVLRCTQLSEIVFNFPHVGGKMKIHENRKLLRDFFLSAGRVLRPGSLVRVALCRGQGGTPAESHVRCPGNTWQVVEMAAPGGFILHQVLPFCAPAGYTPRGYRGGAKGFHTEGALTHVFCLVGSAIPVLPSAAPSATCAEQNLVATRISSLSDWRLLLPQPGPKPLFPTASFTHDLSFWLGEGFDQGNFLTFILNKVGDLLRSMDLIDDYLDSKTGRRSQCFRLCYQSLWKALSQEAARDFHLALGVDVSQVLPVTVR
ncbi:ferredoxin-fold anticodon-binding domain-containing protein 1 isoform X5 [Rhipicephalus sanguineus]|uniref:ferredoxin-fold anticodon-binding domain-containing protein 1 isoform X5 n=1 Tax=Rhipicephalus sanguineus TaxID=34632 RepID=UPI0020C22AFE|nr:ferredoxin-fold anticodon-binding domain-containing protein 1 isoform X5 [Rhipicephalus sanguineus]